MDVRTTRLSRTSQGGDDIAIRDNDNREIVIKRSLVPHLIRQLKYEKKRAPLLPGIVAFTDH